MALVKCRSLLFHRTRMIKLLKVSGLFFALLAIHVTVESIAGTQITIPGKCRTEGKITFIYPEGGFTIEHHLAFEESLDASAAKSTISIGYVSHPPRTYYKKDAAHTLVLSSEGICKPAVEKNAFFLPELSWFVERLLPGIDVTKRMNETAHSVGPTGLLRLLLNMDKPEYNFTGNIVHRNLPCNVFSRLFRPEGGSITISIDVFMPSNGVIYRKSKSDIFTVKIMTVYDKPTEVGRATQDPSTLIVDYYTVESLDNQDSSLNSMIDDFNLPVGHGCSSYLPTIEPAVRAQSFSMLYEQYSSSRYSFLAFDHSANLLRRELLGESVSIWDLSEDLLYHINTNATALLKDEAKLKQDSYSCSVLKVVDEELSSAYRPYELKGESLDVLKMLGASNIAFLARGLVRDMPCLIYETTLSEPPAIFGLTKDQLHKNITESVRYIVQFHLLEGELKSDEELSSSVDEKAFWPARIVLQKFDPKLNSIEFIDQLDVFDFHWSLDGWNTKSSELFLASECFTDQDEQVRLETSISFDKDKLSTSRDDHRSLLVYNKFKLEYDLLKEVTDSLMISKMHLLEYKLKLRPNHVNLEMTIADRKENRELIYYGDGTLPSFNTYESNRILMTRLSEEKCVLLSSHIEDISMVIYCPYDPTMGDSSCISIYGENEPIIRNKNSDDTNSNRICRTYRYSSTPAPIQATARLFERHQNLLKHQLQFLARIPGQADNTKLLEGVIDDYDLFHKVKLLSVGHYSFSTSTSATDGKNLSNQNVRSIDSLRYESLSDCVNMCNLDTSCKSYSYCLNEEEGQRCLLSSLDLRASNVQDQLVNYSTLSSDNRVSIRSNTGPNYELKFADRCTIYERDYLSMFRQTDEIIRVDESVSTQFRVASSTFECAKMSVDLELKMADHHIAMFAYCPSQNANLCLMDENLFNPSLNNGTQITPSHNELLCRVYRKKYQTYFNVSSSVVKRTKNQLELTFNSVEECARACWNKFGKVCSSFDFCIPGVCLINQVSVSTSFKGSDFEVRSGCLHYQRDLRFDEVRSNHMIGKQELLLQTDDGKSGYTFMSFLMNLFTYCLVAGAFIYGLVLGKIANDRMERVTIIKRSISLGSGLRSSQRANFSSTENRSNFARSIGGSSGLNAIRLGVINGQDDSCDPLDQDF